MARLHFVFLTLVFLLVSLSIVVAEDAKAPLATVLPLEVKGNVPSSISQALQDSLGGLLHKEGFELADPKTTETYIRFEVSGILLREKDNLVLQVKIIDKPIRTVIASDMISVFYGLSSIEVINQSLAAVVKQAKDYIDDSPKRGEVVPPMMDAVSFLSPDNGAKIYWRGHELVGTVVKGRVTAPFYPFPSNAELTLTIEKADYRTKNLVVHLHPDMIDYKIPALEKLRVEEIVFGISGGRLLGVGADYRRYFIPDWAYWGFGAYPFVQYRPDVQGSRPVLHLDIDGRVGSFFFFPADSWFRFGLESGVNIHNTLTISAQTPGYYLDVSVMPFGVVMEYNLFGLTFDTEAMVPYALGITPNNLLGQRWLTINNMIPILSLGMVYKW